MSGMSDRSIVASPHQVSVFEARSSGMPSSSARDGHVQLISSAHARRCPCSERSSIVRCAHAARLGTQVRKLRIKRLAVMDPIILATLALVVACTALVLALRSIDRRLRQLVQLSRVAIQPRMIVERVQPGPAGLVATIRNVGNGPALGLVVTLDGITSESTVSALSGSGGAVLVQLGTGRTENTSCLHVACRDELGRDWFEEVELRQRGAQIDIVPRPFVGRPPQEADLWPRAAHAAQWITVRRLHLKKLELTPAVIAVVALNALLAVLYVWSWPGYTTDVSVDVVGTHYHAVMDGREIIDGDVPGPASGGVTLSMHGEDSLPTGAGAPRVRSFQVTDTQTGSRLLGDDFTGGSGAWAGNQTWPGGWVPAASGLLTTGERTWTDYRVDLVLQNPITVDLFVRYTDDGTNVHLNFRPWRDLDSGLVAEQTGVVVGTLPGHPMQLDSLQTVRGLLAVVLRLYPWFALASALLSLTFILMGRVEWMGARRWVIREPPAWAFTQAATSLAAIAVVGLAYAQTVYLERIPHVPDSAIYLFQAKMFAAGLIAAPAPAVPESFEVFPDYMVPLRGLWVSQYPFGHPLLLALGERLGQAWLVAPVVGGLSVLVVFWMGRTMYSSKTGLLGALLLVASPFFQMSNVDFMSHGSGALYLLCAVLGLVTMISRRSRRARILGAAVSGVALGLLFNTRPLTGAASVVVVGLFVVVHLLRDRRRLPEVLGLAAGGGLLLLAYFAYNSYLMGSPLATPYTLGNTASLDNLGFSGHLTVERALSNVYTSLTLLDVVLFAWPAGVALLLVLFPFVLGSMNRWDYLLGELALGTVVAWFFYIDPFIMYGPRLWYEMAPLLVLLAARGISVGVVRARSLACALGRGDRSEWIVEPVAALVIASLVLFSFLTWWGPPAPTQAAYVYVPQNVHHLSGFNSTDARILDVVHAQGLHTAVVLVADDCPGWWCYGSVFPENDPLLQGDIIYARDRGPDATQRLRELYPQRRFYRATYTQPSIITEITAS
jgi:hypothetical protein